MQRRMAEGMITIAGDRRLPRHISSRRLEGFFRRKKVTFVVPVDIAIQKSSGLFLPGPQLSYMSLYKLF